MTVHPEYPVQEFKEVFPDFEEYQVGVFRDESVMKHLRETLGIEWVLPNWQTGKPEVMHIGPTCTVDYRRSDRGYRYFMVRPNEKIVNDLLSNLLHIEGDVGSYDVIEWSDGVAGVFFHYGKIIGSRHIATIRLDSIPKEPGCEKPTSET